MKATDIEKGAVLDGSYRLLNLLGRGGMGEVWEAEHTRLPKRVAVKFLLEAATGQAELVIRFRREAEIASRLVHHSIVEVFDFNILEDGTPYLVMERLIGEDLRSRLDRDVVPLSEAREIIEQVASGLELAHREGVVHRDLKPENLFLCHQADGSLRAKILDFGISKIQGVNTYATCDDRILGTPGYMAPEQAMGKNSEIDARTDIFSLAAIFYEMLTGTSAFLGNTLAEMVYKIVHVAPEPISSVAPDIPPEISGVIERALSKDPAQRYQSVSHFASGIGAVSVANQDELFERQVNPTGATVVSQNISPSSVTNFSAGEGSSGAAGATWNKPAVLSAQATVSELPAGTAKEPDSRGPSFDRAATGRPGGRWVVAVAAVALLAIGAGAAMFFVRSVETSMPTARVQATVAAESAVARTQPAWTEITPATPIRPVVDSVGSVEPATTVEPSKPERPVEPSKRLPTATASQPKKTTPSNSGGGKTTTKSNADTAKSAKQLRQSAAALQAGDPGRALRLARSSLSASKSPRAYTLMGKAYCAMRDVGMVRAMLRNLGAGSKSQVRAYCKARGVNVQ